MKLLSPLLLLGICIVTEGRWVDEPKTPPTPQELTRQAAFTAWVPQIIQLEISADTAFSPEISLWSYLDVYIKSHPIHESCQSSSVLMLRKGVWVAWRKVYVSRKNSAWPGWIYGPCSGFLDGYLQTYKGSEPCRMKNVMVCKTCNSTLSGVTMEARTNDGIKITCFDSGRFWKTPKVTSPT